MIIYQVPVPKKQLLEMPEDERTFILGAGHIANEIMVIQKAAVASSNAIDWEDRLLSRVQVTHLMTLLKVLAGQLLEAHNFLGIAFNKSLKRAWTSENIGSEAIEALDAINQYFGKSKCAARTIRNKFGFHYDATAITAATDRISEKESWEIIISKARGNSLYYVSDLVAISSVIHEIAGGEDFRASAANFMDEITLLGASWATFVQGCWNYVLQKYFNDDELQSSQMKREVSDAPNVRDLWLPFFCEV